MNIEGSYAPSYAAEQTSGSVNGAVHYLLEVLRRRFLILLIITLAAFAAATILAYMATPRFSATTRVKIDPRQNAAIGVDTPNSGDDQLLLETEVNVIESRDVAVMVVKNLRLYDDPDFAPTLGSPLAAMRHDSAPFIEAVATKLLGGLDVARTKSTYVIDISYMSTSPTKAAQFANAFAQAYMEYSVGARSGTASQKANFLETRLQAAGKDLAVVESQAAQLKAQAGIIGGGSNGSFQGTVTDQEAASLSSQLATAQSQASAVQARLNVARQQIASGGLDTVSAVLDSSVIADLRRQRSEVMRDLGAIQTRYGPKHPESLRVSQQLQQIDEQIQQEARRVIGGLASDAAAENAKVATLQSEMNQLRGQQSAKVRAGVMAQSIEQQAVAKRNTYNQLSSEMQQASQLSRNTQTQAQVVEEAVAPRNPSSPNKRLYMALGLLFGLTLGTGVIATQELMANGMRSTEDVEKRLGLRFITSIPRVSATMLQHDGQTISPAELLIHHPVIPFAEAFRVARNTLRLSGTGVAGRNKVLALVSSLPDEGKTTSVLCMARVMAQSGDKILLIDGDLRKASLSRTIPGEHRKGLIELLHGEATLAEVLEEDIVSGLTILPLSKPLFSAEDMFGTDSMRGLLDDLKPHYDHILFDTPPLLGIADSRTIAALADSVVLLIRWAHTPVNAVKSGLAWLEADRTPVTGAIYTMVDPKSEALSAMYYSQNYANYFQGSKG